MSNPTADALQTELASLKEENQRLKSQMTPEQIRVADNQALESEYEQLDGKPAGREVSAKEGV